MLNMEEKEEILKKSVCIVSNLKITGVFQDLDIKNWLQKVRRNMTY